jgi:hypothetical protein
MQLAGPKDGGSVYTEWDLEVQNGKSRQVQIWMGFFDGEVSPFYRASSLLPGKEDRFRELLGETKEIRRQGISED